MLVCRGGQDEVDDKSTIMALQYRFCPCIPVGVVALYKHVQGMMLSSQHVDACFVILTKRSEYKSKKQINASLKFNSIRATRFGWWKSKEPLTGRKELGTSSFFCHLVFVQNW